jgi:hypothetical protein
MEEIIIQLIEAVKEVPSPVVFLVIFLFLMVVFK